MEFEICRFCNRNTFYINYYNDIYKEQLKIKETFKSMVGELRALPNAFTSPVAGEKRCQWKIISPGRMTVASDTSSLTNFELSCPCCSSHLLSSILSNRSVLFSPDNTPGKVADAFNLSPGTPHPLSSDS